MFLMPREDTDFGKYIEATQKITCLVFFTFLLYQDVIYSEVVLM
jgi:hypothetical protein